MTIIAAGLILVILALIVAIVIRERDHDDTRQALSAGWDRERQALLNRIQRPDLLPAPSGTPSRVTPARDAKALAQVGAISLAPAPQHHEVDDAA